MKRCCVKISSTSLWVAGVIIALLAGVHFLIVRPATQKRELLQADIARKQAALAAFDLSTASVRVMGAKVDALRPALDIFESRLVPSREMNKVLEDLWRMAEANSLQTRTVKTPALKQSENFKEQEIDLSLAGSFSSHYQFLLQLEEMKRIVRIKKMNLTNVNATDGQVQGALTLSVFFAP
jgi:Tfp pilus assembly protein PilO